MHGHYKRHMIAAAMSSEHYFHKRSLVCASNCDYLCEFAMPVCLTGVLGVKEVVACISGACDCFHHSPIPLLYNLVATIFIYNLQTCSPASSFVKSDQVFKKKFERVMSFIAPVIRTFPLITYSLACENHNEIL